MIEGIRREPTDAEIEATCAFLGSDSSAEDVIALQKVYAPGKPLRDKIGMNVQVGGYVAPPGNPNMREELEHVLNNADPWSLHVAFEMLHPFMDGNGRTGRAVWLWVMFQKPFPASPLAIGFLHRFYYQTLAAQSDIEVRKTRRVEPDSPPAEEDGHRALWERSDPPEPKEAA